MDLVLHFVAAVPEVEVRRKWQTSSRQLASSYTVSGRERVLSVLYVFYVRHPYFVDEFVARTQSSMRYSLTWPEPFPEYEIKLVEMMGH